MPIRVLPLTPFDVFLKKKWDGQLRKNEEEIISAAQNKDKDLVSRIVSHRQEKMTEDERAQCTTEHILNKILTDAEYRRMWRKEPTKQNIYESAQMEWIKLHLYANLVKLPNNIGGKCIVDGTLQTVSSKNSRASNASKTLDAYVPSCNCYHVNKYTKGSGGAQDNQYKDVKDTLSKAVKLLQTDSTANVKFAFFLDGSYYTAAKIKSLHDMIPADLKHLIEITKCADILPRTTSNTT
jgi:hypothetical protein